MRTPPLYVIVSPVRDEAAHIAQTLQSVVGQTVRPAKWVIVDDGSKDDTGSIVDSYAARHPWIEVIHCADRGHRVAGGGVMDAFYAGFTRVEHDAWDFAAKLDGDVSFHSDYFQRCLEHFATDPQLGIGGGTVFTLTKEGLSPDSVGDPPFHVRGTAKIYRRACFQQIGPLVRAPGWDTLDEVRANLLGWSTRTFPDVGMVHHKPTGSAYGSWADAFKNGRANYISGYHPAFMLAKCAKRMFSKPYVVQAAGLGAGFLSGYLKRLPQLADAETIRFLRHQQIQRLLLRRSIYG